MFCSVTITRHKAALFSLVAWQSHTAFPSSECKTPRESVNTLATHNPWRKGVLLHIFEARIKNSWFQLYCSRVLASHYYLGSVNTKSNLTLLKGILEVQKPFPSIQVDPWLINKSSLSRCQLENVLQIISEGEIVSYAYTTHHSSKALC